MEEKLLHHDNSSGNGSKTELGLVLSGSFGFGHQNVTYGGNQQTVTYIGTSVNFAEILGPRSRTICFTKLCLYSFQFLVVK